MKLDVSYTLRILGAVAICLLLAAPRAHAQRQALSLSGDGIVGAADAPELDIAGDQITVEVWIKHDGQSDQDAIIVNKGTTGDGYRLSFAGSGEEPGLRFAIDDVDYGNYTISSNSGVPAHQWTHVAVTYDGSQYVLYIDGQIDNIDANSGLTVGSNDNPLRIGSDNGGTGRFYRGQIDDVRLWNVARNQFEIGPSPFNPPAGDESGLRAYYTFDDASEWPVSDLAGADDALTRAGTAPLVHPGIYPIPPNVFTLSENAQVELQWNERIGPNDENDAAVFKVYRSTAPDGSDRTELVTVDGATTSYTDTGVNNGTLYYYEITSIDDAGAESGYSQMVTARPYSTHGGGSLAIDRGSYATMSDRPSLNGYAQQLVNFDQTLTLEVWIKHDGQSDEDAILVNKGTTANGYRLSFAGSGEEPGLRFAIDDIDYGNYTMSSNSGVPAHQWTHVAATYDGSQYALYINGQLDNTDDNSGRSVGTNDNPLRIGTDNGGTGRFYSGQLDELRLWNVARTQPEIAANFRQELVGDEAALITYFRFDDIGDVSAQSMDAKHETMQLLGSASITGGGALPLPPYGYANGSNASAELAWQDRNAEAASQFKVYRSTVPEGSDRTELATFGAGTTSYTDTDVDNGTLYFYEVTAIDANGQESEYAHFDPALASASLGGTTLVLDGDNDYATVTDRPSLNGYAQQVVNFDQTLTLEVWIKHDGQSDEDAIIVNKGTTENGYRLSFAGSGEEPGLRFAIDDVDYGNYTISSNSGVPAHQWTHVAATYDGSQYALYIDGQLDNTDDNSGRSVGTNDNPLRIGTDNGATGGFFSGQLDELRLWNVARTQPEIAAEYEQELAGDEADLIAYFRFNESGSTTARSSATLPMTAELVNGAGMGEVSALPAEDDDVLPEAFALEGNYPNPFSGSSMIRYALPETAQVRITVYDALGRQIETLVDTMLPAGTHDVSFDASGLSNGIYIYRVEAGTSAKAETMTVVR